MKEHFRLMDSASELIVEKLVGHELTRMTTNALKSLKQWQRHNINYIRANSWLFKII
jgi:hypothetical protein